MDHVTNGSLRFEVDEHGPPGGEPVILLHGFPADRACWGAVAATLAAAGYRTLAPEQRGYSPGARPPRRRDHRIDLLAGDVIALADRAGADRFHLAGHDWGALVAWHVAGTHPGRVATLTAVSVPHPAAVRAALVTSRQALHSWYVAAFQLPGAERALGLAGGRLLARSLRSSGLSAEVVRRYAARAAAPGGLRGPLGWYRALPWSLAHPTPPSPVPTTMLWGRGDRFVGRSAVRRCAASVTGSYRLVELPASHWLPEEDPVSVAVAILEAAGAHPIAPSETAQPIAPSAAAQPIAPSEAAQPIAPSAAVAARGGSGRDRR